MKHLERGYTTKGSRVSSDLEMKHVQFKSVCPSAYTLLPPLPGVTPTPVIRRMWEQYRGITLLS